MTRQVAVILGGTGMVGANMAQLLDQVGGWGRDHRVAPRPLSSRPRRATYLAT
jgi:aspartate-semialdehyde dehydrogenase